MKKFNSNKNIIIALVIAIIMIFLVTYTANQRNQSKQENIAQSVTNDVVGLVDKGLSVPLKAVQRSVRAVGNLFNTYDENDHLKRKLDDYASLKNENQTYKDENEKLKQQLELNATVSNYEHISASVISRSPDSWQDLLIIDRGTKDGIEVNMPVMGNKGLIGRVVVANTMSSKVELLSSSNQNSNHFPVMIKPTEGEMAYGLLEGYDETEKAFVVTQLTSTEQVKEGDTVSTSGLGGNSPKGLLIGTVKKSKNNSFGLDKKVYVTPASSMYEISTVTVIKRLAESGE